MRIVLTTESSLPYVSGVTVSVDALARGLGARGHEVMVVGPRPADGRTPDPVGSPGPQPSHAWLPSYELPVVVPVGYRMPWPNPLAGAWREARYFRPDVVHAHSPFVTGLGARRLARSVDAPLVFTHHTRFGDYGHYLGPLARPGRAATEAMLASFWAGCAAIVAPSGDLAAEIRERLPADRRDRVHVVPTGIDVSGIRALPRVDVRPDAGWPPDAPVIATLGRLAPEKSVDVVLDAAAHALDAVPAARVLVIGGGASEPELRARAAATLGSRATFTGALPRTAALARLRASDVFAFASRTETQGLVLAEALAAGLPAVAVSAPGVADSIRDGVDGLIVAAEPEASRAVRLGDAIASVLADGDLRATMSRRATADADRFDLARRVAETEAVYRAAGA
jgi:1,2-diacylglycerol 3-alpha-glucosyltransferase